jgi:hypothetical protein
VTEKLETSNLLNCNYFFDKKLTSHNVQITTKESTELITLAPIWDQQCVDLGPAARFGAVGRRSGAAARPGAAGRRSGSGRAGAQRTEADKASLIWSRRRRSGAGRQGRRTATSI